MLHKQSAWMGMSLITLTVTQTVRIALRVFAMGTYMQSVGDAENVSKNTVCICMYYLCASKVKSSVIRL